MLCFILSLRRPNKWSDGDGVCYVCVQNVRGSPDDTRLANTKHGEQSRKTRRATDIDVVVCFWIILCIVLSLYPCELLEHTGGLKVQIRLAET